MTSPFVALARDAQRVAFEHHAELWRWIPMKSAPGDRNAPPVYDDARSPAVVRGIYFEKKADPLIRNAFDPRTDQRPGVSNAHPRVEFSADCSEAQQVFQAGDTLVRLSNERRYRIMTTLAKKTGVQVCTVNSQG